MPMSHAKAKLAGRASDGYDHDRRLRVRLTDHVLTDMRFDAITLFFQYKLMPENRVNGAVWPEEARDALSPWNPLLPYRHWRRARAAEPARHLWHARR